MSGPQDSCRKEYTVYIKYLKHKDIINFQTAQMIMRQKAGNYQRIFKKTFIEREGIHDLRGTCDFNGFKPEENVFFGVCGLKTWNGECGAETTFQSERV